MNKKLLSQITLFLLILVTGVSACSPKTLPSDEQSLFTLQNNTGSGFEKAVDPRAFSFPDDFGAHDGFQTEWWYYTGNLISSEGRRFGYQLTFFRRGISAELPETRDSAWAAKQIYAAHFTITDSDGGRHLQEEKLARGAAGLAGVRMTDGFSVWLYDWFIRQTGDAAFSLYAQADGFSIELVLHDSKGVVLHGINGLSQKGPEPGNASYYFSQTRLKSEGVLRIGGEAYDVSGDSWMDHEFGSSTLAADQIGWDWFSLQFEDGEELMLFQLRQEDGGISEFSSGTLIRADGSTLNLHKEDFSIEVLQSWQTKDGFVYPAEWRLQITELGMDVTVEPLLADQENRFFFRYWEGAVKFSGAKNGKTAGGFGYVELTGYAQSMQGVF